MCDKDPICDGHEPLTHAEFVSKMFEEAMAQPEAEADELELDFADLLNIAYKRKREVVERKLR
jgi:hypothetical protein